MVQYCCCYGCNEKYVKGGTVTFHGFPKDEQRVKIWLQKIKRENFVPTKYSKVCSKHFAEECFDRERFGNVWLKSDAVPTIFDFPQHKWKVPSRKLPTKRNISSAGNQQSLPDCSEEGLPIVGDGMENANENMSYSVPSTSESNKRAYRYLGDFEEEMNCPKKAKQALHIARSQVASQRRKIDQLRTSNKRCQKKVLSLSALLAELKEKTNLSDEICQVLEFQEMSDNEEKPFTGDGTSLDASFFAEAAVGSSRVRSPSVPNDVSPEYPQEVAQKRKITLRHEELPKKLKLVNITDTVSRAVSSMHRAVDSLQLMARAPVPADESEAFGQVVAAHLRALPTATALDCQAEILNYLLEQRRNGLAAAS